MRQTTLAVLKRNVLIVATMLPLWSSAFASTPGLKPPSAESIVEARSIVSAMKSNPRGPYESIRWFCNDGTVLPPKEYACTNHGGGKQHAVFSAQQKRLAELGWRVGTIYASFEALNAEPKSGNERTHLRLRELPLEKYLIDIDDGWVLHKARSYRGRVQLEDEQEAGGRILLGALSDPHWKKEHFLLMRELARVVPHSYDREDPSRNIRRQSQALAELDNSFQPLRAEVHGQPTKNTAPRIREWLSAKISPSEQITTLAEELMAELETLYSENGSALRLAKFAEGLKKHDARVSAYIKEAAKAQNSAQRLASIVSAIVELRRVLDETANANINLKRLDLMQELEAELLVLSRTSAKPVTRVEALNRLSKMLAATQSLGWLSTGEHSALAEPIVKALHRQDGVAAEEYRQLIRRLQLAPAWAQASIKHTFAESLTNYEALDPRSAQFVDDLLRGSSLMALAELTQQLLLDSGRLTGKRSFVFGTSPDNVWGLNPGAAKGRLRILTTGKADETNSYRPEDIIVIPNSTSTLFPAAGIVTVGEGNPLSHIQILARNLGIPNIVIDEALLAQLKAYDGHLIEMAVASDGRVLLRKIDVDAHTKNDISSAPDTGKVRAPVPDLSVTKPLPLSELYANLSGHLVGPKAANVGELAKLFPDRIAPAVALPFGIFALHTESGKEAPRTRLKQAFAKYQNHEFNEEEFLAELDNAREQVATLTLIPDARAKLIEAMDKEFGTNHAYGVFVRSDTNMEDLPQFTGAGLNETIPNVIGLEKQLAAISKVWASVYSRRAMAWRSRILQNPDDVFSSVLLMKSVPSDKSGVLVTTDLTGGTAGYTVSLSWGVGGAVDNESAASYLLKPNGEDILLSEAKAPYQRYLKPEGGVGWRPASSGAVLTVEERSALRALASEVIAKYPPALDDASKPLPWDIEFGFAEGKLMLLQIRPLVQRGALAAEKIVSSVIPKTHSDRIVLLQDPLLE